MKQYLLVIVLLSFLSASSFAEDDYRAIAIEAKNHMPQQLSVYRQDAENAQKAEKNLAKPYQSDAQFSQKQESKILTQLSTKARSAKKISSILIFVSFSLPTQSLEAYLQAAKKIEASIVIRGLINNSFQQTYQRMDKLIKTSGGNGMELNPIWFKRFGIHVVPAVVIVPEGSPCFKSNVCEKDHDFDIMTGDITLAAALKIMRDRGQLTSEIAQTALDELEGGPNA